MEIVQSLKEFGITGFDAVLLCAIAYLARFILTRYDADIQAKISLSSALEKLSEAVKDLQK